MQKLQYSLKMSPYVRDKRKVERRENIQAAIYLALGLFVLFLNSLIPEL